MKTTRCFHLCKCPFSLGDLVWGCISLEFQRHYSVIGSAILAFDIVPLKRVSSSQAKIRFPLRRLLWLGCLTARYAVFSATHPELAASPPWTCSRR